MLKTQHHTHFYHLTKHKSNHCLIRFFYSQPISFFNRFFFFFLNLSLDYFLGTAFKLLYIFLQIYVQSKPFPSIYFFPCKHAIGIILLFCDWRLINLQVITECNYLFFIFFNFSFSNVKYERRRWTTP